MRRFPVLEVQHTFYEPPANAVLTRWRTQVPDTFEFTIKAWQIVTHESTSPPIGASNGLCRRPRAVRSGVFRTTSPVLAGWQRTLECARLLRATAVLLQCPPSSGPTADNVGRLRGFVSQMVRPAGRLLWEPRGAWPTPLLKELCADLDLVHVVDPMQTETVTPEQTYYRLHGTAVSRHVHADDELHRLRALVDGRPSPYVMFDNLPRVGHAERFLTLLSL